MDKISSTVTYQYQILRYRHDVATGEFVNVGLVYFDTQARFLRVRMTKKQARITHFFGDVEGEHLLRTFKSLENEFNRWAVHLKNNVVTRQFSSVQELTNIVLPPNDNALFFSPIFKGIDTDHNNAFNDLYHCLIGKYNGETIEQQVPNVLEDVKQTQQLILAD